MARLHEKGVSILMTLENLIVGKTGADRIFAIKVVGGATFTAAAVAEDDSTGSAHKTMVGFGLTQECNMGD